MDEESKALRVYGRTELARLYFGQAYSDRTARRWLAREIGYVPGLWERLRQLGYTERGKIFTREQVKAIFEALGPP